MATHERFPASVSVSLLLTHGRSNRLFLTRHQTGITQTETWGLIAGGVEKGESPWDAAIREAQEEAGLKGENIIFVRGRNSFEPHVAMIKREDKIRLGLVFDATYSGPKVSMDGWDIKGDHDVDRVEFFPWPEVLDLLDEPSKIYRPEFNYPQLIRWILKDYWDNKGAATINRWLQDRQGSIPGLNRKRVVGTSDTTASLSDWEYIPPYNSWIGMPGIRGIPSKTSLA